MELRNLKMKAAIISDIHGNSLLLKEFFKAIKNFQIKRVFFLGDAVNYYPDCNEVIELLTDANVVCVKGNHDEMVISNAQVVEQKQKIYQLHQTNQTISSTNREIITNWKSSISTKIDDKKVLMLHGSPIDHLNGYIYPDSDLSKFNTKGFDYVFIGHSHYSMIRKKDKTTFVNPGSLGMPRDVGNRFSFAIVDFETDSIKIENINYPIDKIKKEYKYKVHPKVLDLLDKV